MAGTTLKIDGTEVALGGSGGSGGTIVNITLRQESGMAYLCKGAVSLVHRRAAAKDDTGASPSRRPHGGEQKVFGVAQILLGVVCIGIGVALSMVEPNDYIPYYYKRAIYNGVPFWSGSLFVLSGTFSVVGARHGGNWVHLATFLNLGSVVAGSVAFTVGLTEFPSPTYQPYFLESLCKHRAEDWSYRYWEATTSPPYDNQRDQERARQCQEALWALVLMWSSTHILLLILHSAALAIALFCFGYGLRHLCCSCWGGWQDYMAMEDADASEEPGKEQNPA
ncbi:LOW QUALITY PROTEIN: transmembrane protein 176B-like [Pituophis catenifer annectens]|uniref:LOW QUALITY PROTEIN: transmembrane protein 176B-like n=1 Tax=Pituophis catenifer annectens TaxID=94852 RepID=UPI003994557F